MNLPEQQINEPLGKLVDCENCGYPVHEAFATTAGFDGAYYFCQRSECQEAYEEFITTKH